MAVATVKDVKAAWAPSGHEQMAHMDSLGEELRRQAGDLAAAEYRWLVTLEEFDRGGGWYQQGARTCAQWLSWACGLGPEAARERIRVARALPQLPKVSGSFAEGRLSYSKVRAITRIATPENEALLTAYGLSAPAAQVEEIVRQHRRLLDGDDDAQSAHERRFLRWTTLADGRVRITAEYPPEEAAKVIAKIGAVAERLGEDTAPPTVPAGGQTSEQLRELVEAGAPEAPVMNAPWDVREPLEIRRADALVRLVEAARPEDGPSDDDRTRVILHVRQGSCACGAGAGGTDPGEANGADGANGAGAGAEAISAIDEDEIVSFDRVTEAARQAAEDLGRSSTGCTMDDGTVIAAETAKRLACDAEILTMVEDALGNPVGVGRKTRKIPRRLRRALRHRDGGCRFPSCTARRWVDAHHVWFWRDGGPTELWNLVLLCRHHHRLVHEAGYKIRSHPGQRFTFHRPDGTLIPGSAAPVPGEAHAPAAANARAGVVVDEDCLIPDWDGGPTDYDAALERLWDATFPAESPAGAAVSAVPLASASNGITVTTTADAPLAASAENRFRGTGGRSSAPGATG